MMKSVASENALNPDYPYLGISRFGDIVLFSGRNAGTCLLAVRNSLGEYSDGWVESDFAPYSGSVALSN